MCKSLGNLQLYIWWRHWLMHFRQLGQWPSSTMLGCIHTKCRTIQNVSWMVYVPSSLCRVPSRKWSLSLLTIVKIELHTWIRIDRTPQITVRRSSGAHCLTVSSRINNDACYVCACDDSVAGTETVLYRGQLVRTALQHCIGARWPLSERERESERGEVG